MAEFDSPWKEALERFFPSFMAFFFPEAHADIDWPRGFEFLDKELQQVLREAELGRRTVDKLVKVWRRDGQEAWVLIHVEVQCYEEGDFPVRMFVCHYRLFDRYNRQVVSLAVLGDERAAWRPSSYGHGLWSCSIDFRFPVVKLLDYADKAEALESDPNPFAVVVLAHLKTQETRDDVEARRAWKLRLIKGLYVRGLSAADVRELFRVIDWMLNLPEPVEALVWREIQLIEEENRMPYVTSVERIGIEKGHKEGERQGLYRGIELGLELKFGSEGAKLVPEIRQLADVPLLGTVLEAIKTATTPEELRRLWSP